MTSHVNLQFLDESLEHFADLSNHHDKDNRGGGGMAVPGDIDIQCEKDVEEEKSAILSNMSLSRWLNTAATTSSEHETPTFSPLNIRSLGRFLWSNRSLTTLDLSNLGLEYKDAVYLARALKNNNTLLQLDLSGNKLGPKFCSEMGAALSCNSGLQILNMDYNNSLSRGDEDGNHGIKALAEGLADNETLLELSLRNCNINTEGGQILCRIVCDKNTRLVSVEIDNNHFCLQDVNLLGEWLESNMNRRDEQLAEEAKRNRGAVLAREMEIKAEQEMKKVEHTREFLEQEKRHREMRRALELKEAKEAAMKEKELQRQKAHAQQKEHERVAVKTKKKGKGKGKKK